jgi:hypothetical protein
MLPQAHTRLWCRWVAGLGWVEWGGVGWGWVGWGGTCRRAHGGMFVGGCACRWLEGLGGVGWDIMGVHGGVLVWEGQGGFG